MSYELSNIGDLLITNKHQEGKLPARSSSPWEEVAQFANTTLWMTRSDEKWHGFPLQTYQDGAWQIWALGEFYETQPDLSQALATSADLNGHFLIFAFEKSADRWHILTDRFGTVHAYYANDGSRKALGTYSPSVAEAASSKQLDWYAIGGFFQFSFFLGDSTYWGDVRLFKPATHTILDGDGVILTQHQTWNWFHEPDPHFNQEDSLNAFKELFQRVIYEEVKDKSVAIPISGGLDSRSTLIPLTDQSAHPATDLFYFSYGFGEDSIETSIAKKLAQKRELDLTTWSIQPYLFDRLDRVLTATEGFQDLTLSRQADVVDQLGKQASHVLAVHWMDVWLDDMDFLDVPAPLTDQALTVRMLKKFTKNGPQHLQPLFKDWLPPNQEHWITGEITSALNSLKAINDLDFKVKAWKTWQWSFRWTLPSLRMYQPGLFTLVPFYDHRIADFFCQLPSKPLNERAFQIEYLKRYAPDLARVPWQAYYNANLYEYQHFNTWLLPRRALNKLGRLLRREQVIERNWELQFLKPRGRQGLQDWLLTPGLKLHNFVSLANLTAFLRDFYAAPDAANGYAASMLLTFSAWLEKYG
jgi:asparagine synthase (glutamine-hydrolysing)